MQRPGTSHSQKINEEIRKQLLPRTEKLKEMIQMDEIPQSSEHTIIVPCLQKTLGFKTNQYEVNKSFLDGFISKLDFNKFVRNCNKIVQEEVIGKTKKQNESFFGIISTLLNISIIIAILTFFLLASIVFFSIENQTQNIILILAGILLASASMIAVICPIVLYNSKYETINYEETIKQRLQKLVQTQNGTLETKGKKYLHWKVQSNFFWLQLHIDSGLYHRTQIEEQKPQLNNESQVSNISANNFLKRKSPKSNELRKVQMIHDF